MNDQRLAYVRHFLDQGKEPPAGFEAEVEFVLAERAKVIEKDAWGGQPTVPFGQSDVFRRMLDMTEQMKKQSPAENRRDFPWVADLMDQVRSVFPAAELLSVRVPDQATPQSSEPDAAS
jgi:hypothetical protein